VSGDFAAAVDEALVRLGPLHTGTLGLAVGQGLPPEAVVHAVPLPEWPRIARRVLDAMDAAALTAAEAGAYIRGAAAGWASHEADLQVEPVWSGPGTHEVPVRATGRVLVELAAEATRELTLMTYSAKPYEPLLKALAAAVAREVAVMVVVETLQGAGSAPAGSEPALAFASVPGVEVWHWPPGKRPEQGAKMHAKLVVADRRVLLVSSANLTQSGVGRNIEAGLLVRGGTAPPRAAEHVAELRAKGILERLL
jgi:phosphatidylserine/phosphatidylglycerophosphate/cardiolipin synthase-like enzyme